MTNSDVIRKARRISRRIKGRWVLVNGRIRYRPDFRGVRGLSKIGGDLCPLQAAEAEDGGTPRRDAYIAGRAIRVPLRRIDLFLYAADIAKPSFPPARNLRSAMLRAFKPKEVPA